MYIGVANIYFNIMTHNLRLNIEQVWCVAAAFEHRIVITAESPIGILHIDGSVLLGASGNSKSHKPTNATAHFPPTHFDNHRGAVYHFFSNA